LTKTSAPEKRILEEKMASLEQFPRHGFLGLVEMVENRHENKEIQGMNKNCLNNNYKVY